MATVTTPSLPTPEALDLADYKLGSLGSDLDLIRSALRDCAGPEGAERYDAGVLAQIVVFATDSLRYLSDLQRDAAAIQESAIALHHEQLAGEANPEAWRRYQESARAWHEREAERA